MSSKGKSLGCVFIIIYTITFIVLLIFSPGIVEAFYTLFLDEEKLIRKEFIVQKQIHNSPNQPEEVSYSYIVGTIDGNEEKLFVDENSKKDSIIQVWFYEDGWKSSPLRFNTRVWEYEDDSKKNIKSPGRTVFKIILPFLLVSLITYLYGKFSNRD